MPVSPLPNSSQSLLQSVSSSLCNFTDFKFLIQLQLEVQVSHESQTVPGRVSTVHLNLRARAPIRVWAAGPFFSTSPRGLRRARRARGLRLSPLLTYQSESIQLEPLRRLQSNGNLRLKIEPVQIHPTDSESPPRAISSPPGNFFISNLNLNSTASDFKFFIHSG